MKLSSLPQRYKFMETMINSTGETSDTRRDGLPQRLADGDPYAPREMVEAYYPELYRYARAILRDSHSAEDIVHDTFVNALEAIGKYPEKRIRELALRAWLYRISSNNIRDFFRRSKRRGEVTLSDQDPGDSGYVRDHDVDSVMDVLDALSKLPEKQRVAVTLRYMQDLPYAEIAAATGWPENTAKTHVRRGLTKLRETMDDQHGKEER